MTLGWWQLQSARECTCLGLTGVPRSPGPAANLFWQVIGQGACSHVHRALHIATGRSCAIKTVNKKLVGERMWATACNEVRILQKLKHPHIVEMKECVQVCAARYARNGMWRTECCHVWMFARAGALHLLCHMQTHKFRDAVLGS